MTTQATQPGRPRLSEIEAKVFDIELLIEGYGMGLDTLPATATEPAEEIGIGATYNEQTGLIDLGHDHETYISFAVDVPLAEISKWIEARERESLVF